MRVVASAGVALLLVAALGSCLPAGNSVDEEPLEDVPLLRAGVRISIAPTVLGASLQRWQKDRTGIKDVIVAAIEGDVVTIEWRATVREETEASRRRRAEFENDPPVAGVGEPQPEPPAPEYAGRTQHGRIRAAGLSESRTMTLPILWPEGEQMVEGTSLIWLSEAAFRELRTTRSTRWSVGLLDSPLLQPLALAGELKKGLDALRSRLEKSPRERDDLQRIEAEPEFSSFELDVDGRRTRVRTMVARNWFAEYVVLDDAHDPLVLEVTLNPLSGGALDVFSPLGALKALAGYRVISVDGGPSPGA